MVGGEDAIEWDILDEQLYTRTIAHIEFGRTGRKTERKVLFVICMNSRCDVENRWCRYRFVVQ